MDISLSDNINNWTHGTITLQKAWAHQPMNYLLKDNIQKLGIFREHSRSKENTETSWSSAHYTFNKGQYN